MFITGPDVVKAVTMEEVTDEDLGGASVHATRSGVAHFALDSEESVLTEVRRLLAYLPANNMEDAPMVEMGDDPRRRDEEMLTILPENESHPYDVREVIYRVVDGADFLEVHPDYAQNIVVGFARLGGRTVGIVANQPLYLAGTLDIAASLKGARFVRFCDCFNIPIVTFADVSGYLPGTAQEHGGIITHGAKLVYAYAEATVPKITVHPAQGLRWRLHRHGLEAPRWRRQPRLAYGLYRGHRPGRGRRHRVPGPAGARAGEPAPSSAPTTRTASPTPTSRPHAATSTT